MDGSVVELDGKLDGDVVTGIAVGKDVMGFDGEALGVCDGVKLGDGVTTEKHS